MPTATHWNSTATADLIPIWFKTTRPLEPLEPLHVCPCSYVCAGMRVCVRVQRALTLILRNVYHGLVSFFTANFVVMLWNERNSEGNSTAVVCCNRPLCLLFTMSQHNSTSITTQCWTRVIRVDLSLCVRVLSGTFYSKSSAWELCTLPMAVGLIQCRRSTDRKQIMRHTRIQTHTKTRIKSAWSFFSCSVSS